MKTQLSLFIILLITISGFTQPELRLNQTYGTQRMDMGFDHIRSADGGFAMVGVSANPQNGETDVYFIKTDSRGEVEWDAYYGGEHGDAGYALTQLPDGGYAIAGYTRSFGAGEDDWYFIRIDSEGEELWSRTYGGEHYDACYSVIAHDNGDFSLFGHTWSFGAGEKDYYLIKTDTQGEMIWEQTYGGADFDFGRDHIITTDGGYAMVGYAISIGAAGKNMGLYRANSDGEELWSVAFGNDLNEDCYSIVQSEDGGFALAGYRCPDPDDPDNSNAWLVKTNAEGEIEWEVEYGGAMREEWRDVALAEDGGFILTGYTINENFGSYDLLVARYNADGELLWSDIRGEALAESGSSVKADFDGFSICGNANYGGSMQFWLIQYEPENVTSYFLPIPAGWSYISSPVVPLDDSFVSLWSGVVDRGNLRIAKDNLGRVFFPRLDENNIDRWDNRFGYVVYLFENDSLEFRGSPLPAHTPIPLASGWTLAAYLPEQPQPAEDAFQAVREQLRLVKDDLGRFYLPDYNFSNLGLLRQGKAYLVDVSSNCELVWNDGGHAADSNPAQIPVPKHFNVANPNGQNMSLLAMVKNGSLPVASELGVFNENGACVGSAVIVNGKAGLAIWTDGEIERSLSDDEELSLKIWDGNNERQMDVNWVKGSNQYNRDDYAVAELSVATPIPNGFDVLKIHPNPFNNSTTIQFATENLGNVSLEVFDLSGRLVQTILRDTILKGTHSVLWNAESLTAGVYLLRLQTTEQTIIQKAILAK